MERKDDAEQCVLLLRKLGEPDDTLQVGEQLITPRPAGDPRAVKRLTPRQVPTVSCPCNCLLLFM
jgi:hypothetical protein